MTANFESLNEFVDHELDKLMDEIDRRFEDITRQQLAEWAKRWPNHQFKAWQGHGMLSIEVSPTICGQSHLDHIPDHCRRGAIGQLCEEAEAFVTNHCQLEWKVSTRECGPFLSHEPPEKFRIKIWRSGSADNPIRDVPFEGSVWQAEKQAKAIWQDSPAFLYPGYRGGLYREGERKAIQTL